MEFSMTEQQVPMLLRLLMLLYALQQKQLKPEKDATSDNSNAPSDIRGKILPMYVLYFFINVLSEVKGLLNICFFFL